MPIEFAKEKKNGEFQLNYYYYSNLCDDSWFLTHDLLAFVMWKRDAYNELLFVLFDAFLDAPHFILSQYECVRIE